MGKLMHDHHTDPCTRRSMGSTQSRRKAERGVDVSPQPGIMVHLAPYHHQLGGKLTSAGRGEAAQSYMRTEWNITFVGLEQILF